MLGFSRSPVMCNWCPRGGVHYPLLSSFCNHLLTVEYWIPPAMQHSYPLPFMACTGFGYFRNPIRPVCYTATFYLVHLVPS